MKISTVSKYIFTEFLSAMKYFYAIMVLVIMIFIYLNFRFADSAGDNVTFGGVGFSSLIFIFILGMTFFKTEFHFLLSNNITRKNFFRASLISSAAAAFMMAFIGAAFNQAAIALMPGSFFDWVEGIYKTNSMFADLTWSFSLYILTLITGWLISMIYYKLSKTMRIIVSFIPFGLIVLISAADSSSGGAFINIMGRAMKFMFGLNTLNPYAAALNMIILAALLSGIIYLLLRRQELKA